MVRLITNSVRTQLPRASLHYVWTESPGSGSSFFRPMCRCGPPLPGPAGGGRAPCPRPLQGPVHRLRRVPRQARAAAGPHAPLGARRRPGRDRRAGRHREAQEGSKARRFARTQAPRKTLSQIETSPTTRQIPAAVKRAVCERDGGQCSYEDEQGRRCTAREGLEFHHLRPFGHGGDHSVDNVALVCKCHSGYLAEIDYGREAIARHRRSTTRPLESTPSASP